MSGALSRGFIAASAMVMGLAPLSIDMYLPAMPAIGADLQASASQVQGTMTTYLIGVALGQLIYGATSDALGRKKPLVAGLLVYLLAVMGCALAPDVHSLTLLRFFQALGGCSGLVIVRAMLRDRCEPREMARALGLLMLVMGIAPIVAPLWGSFLFLHLGWRAIFWFLALYALLAAIVAIWYLPETRPQASGKLSLTQLTRGYRRIVQHRRFMGYALAGSLAQVGVFAYMTASAFLFTRVYSVAEEHIGTMFVINTLAYIVGSEINRHLLKRYRTEVLMTRALNVYLVTTTLMVAHALTGWGGLPLMMMLISASLGAVSFSYPNSTALAMSPFKDRAGMASSLLGTMMYVVAGVVAWSVSRAPADSALPMSAAMLVCALLSQLALRWLVKRPRDQALRRRSALRSRPVGETRSWR